MKSRRHLLGAGVLFVALVATASAVLWWVTRGPLAGETYHDFGRVAVAGRASTVEHVFTLTNRTQRPVEIVEIIPSCGCTTVDVSDRDLDPGEQVDLTVSLTVGTGTRKKSITLIVDDGRRERTQLLWVKATGRASEAMSVTRRTLPVGPDAPGQLTLRYETLDEAAPPAPLLETPEGFAARFGGWERSGESANPVRWRAAVEVAQSESVAVHPARLMIRMGRETLAVELLAPE